MHWRSCKFRLLWFSLTSSSTRIPIEASRSMRARSQIIMAEEPKASSNTDWSISRSVSSEPHELLSYRYFQIFVIYLVLIYERSSSLSLNCTTKRTNWLWWTPISVSSCGGGVNSSSDLRGDGRRPDEEEEAYRRRCLIFEIGMVKKHHEKKSYRKR